MEEDIVVKKEKLNKIDFLYIASMVLFALAFLAIRSPIVDIKYDDNVLLSDVWFSAISLYSLGGIICYILGLIKIRKYNNNPKLNDPEMKYKIIHFFGFFNFLLILPLDFGLLFMIMTSMLFKAQWSSILLFGLITLFFLVSFILRSTLLKKEDQLGLRSFDANSFLYYFYATIMMILNVCQVEINEMWMAILIVINFIITNFSVYYPIKAMVYAKERKEFNPVITVYKFVRRLIDMRVFFFIGLLFTLLLGGFYWIGGYYSITDSLLNIYFIIALFYFGVAIVKFFTYFWKRKIEKGNHKEEEKFKSLCKITIFDSITTLILTGLLGVLLVYIFNDSLNKANQSWFIFIQGGFVGLRVVFLIMDIIRANKKKSPFDICVAEGSLLSTSVMVFSIVISINLYFGFNSIHKIISLVLVFIILSSGVGTSVHCFILGLLGLKGKLEIKEKEDLENGD